VPNIDSVTDYRPCTDENKIDYRYVTFSMTERTSLALRHTPACTGWKIV